MAKKTNPKKEKEVIVDKSSEKIRISISLDESLANELKRRAEKEMRTVSNYISIVLTTEFSKK